MIANTLHKTTNKQLCLVLIHYIGKGIIKPAAKAYVFAYLYVVLPKVINKIVENVKKREYGRISPIIAKVLTHGLHPKKFPLLVGLLVAGVNILEPIVYSVLKHQFAARPVNNMFFSTLIAAFISASVTFPQYQNYMLRFNRYYSLDFTLLVATRAIDTMVSSSLSNLLKRDVAKYGDSALFIVSCYFIMYSWFYQPHNLPPSYSRWITSAANMDREVLDLLKHLKDGSLKYGERGPFSDILKPYCERYGQDPKEGDLIINQPLPCKTVHAFKTNSCELHALWRFYRGFMFALKIYGPINIVMFLSSRKNSKLSYHLLRVLQSTVRSSCFLGAFISLTWYGVCLTRSRLFPWLFPNIPRTRWDDTIGPAIGSAACGFGSLIENSRRRKELALFVAPRALGTLISVEPTTQNLKTESFIFSLSLSVLIAYMKYDPTKVRGVFGKGLQHVFQVQSSK